jgi:hypothetical protein
MANITNSPANGVPKADPKKIILRNKKNKLSLKF